MVRSCLSRSRLVVVTLGVLSAGCASANNSHAHRPGVRSEPPPSYERLGHPLGKYLTIEGIRAERGKVGVRSLLVDRINGQEVSPPIGIWIENVDALPKGVRCILNGYESGRMIGVPQEVAEKENMPSGQAMWQFQTYFLVTSVVAPQDLKQTWTGAHGTAKPVNPEPDK